MPTKKTTTKPTADPQPFLDLLGEMNDAILERDDSNEGFVVALLSRQHVFELGKPGTGKSMQVKFIGAALDGAKYWEGLGHPFATPEEFAGAPTLDGMKAGKIRRNIENTLLDCDVGYLDEGFKTNPSALQFLLPIINEREYRENGTTHKLPLQTLLITSNEIPSDDEKELLAAFWDRLLLRFVAPRLRESSSRKKMLRAHAGRRQRGEKAPTPTVSFTREDLAEAQAAVAHVTITADVEDAMDELWSLLKAEGIEVSERQLCQSLDAVQAYAWLHGRDEATTADFAVLRNAYWSELSERETVARIVLDFANPFVRELQEAYDATLGAWEDVKVSGSTADKLEVYDKATSAIQAIHTKAKDLEEEKKDAIRPLFKRLKELASAIENEAYGKAKQVEDL